VPARRPREPPRELLQRPRVAGVHQRGARLPAPHGARPARRAGDAAACATGLALATAVGVLRIAADRHYATDVLLGAGVGLLSGWLLPWLLHYDVGEALGDTTSITVAPRIDDDVIGVQVFGVF
jgi:hypothetical protein